ncbi:MAG: hypothetical protein HWN68_18140 [Desulfobacterales bacterium]|nr:hypothetical protein [Desulfobacterales bacterium]
MAKVSSAILQDALTNVAKLIPNAAGNYQYMGMGAGENDTAAAATQHDLLGSDTHYNDAVGIYEADYKTVWQSTFLYADFTGHIIKELVICQSSILHANLCLLRMTIDAVTLNEGEQVTFIIKNAVQQGT